MIDRGAIRAHARAAYKRAIRTTFVCNYVSGLRTITRHAPDDESFHLSSFCSRDYAMESGSSVPMGRAHLRRLVVLGEIIETETRRNHVSFKMPRTVHDQVGAEIIAELVAEGLPFDDDWRRSEAAR